MPLRVRLRSFWQQRFPPLRGGAGNMSDELQFHLERRTEDLMARDGLSLAEATRIARLEFGSVERYKEEARQDLRPQAPGRSARRPALCVPHVGQTQGLYGDRHRDALARHRCEYGGVQRGRRAAASPASGAEPRGTGSLRLAAHTGLDGGPLFRLRSRWGLPRELGLARRSPPSPSSVSLNTPPRSRTSWPFRLPAR